MRVLPVLGIVMFLPACGSPTAAGPGTVAFTYDFSSGGAQEWVPGSSDYGIPIEPEIRQLSTHSSMVHVLSIQTMLEEVQFAEKMDGAADVTGSAIESVESDPFRT